MLHLTAYYVNDWLITKPFVALRCPTSKIYSHLMSPAADRAAQATPSHRPPALEQKAIVLSQFAPPAALQLLA